MNRLMIALMFGTPVAADAAGTITLINSPLSRMEVFESYTNTVPLPTSSRYYFGVFWGTNRTSLQLALPLGTNSTRVPGILDAPTPYPISGTQPGQTVFLQVRAWSAGFGTNWPGPSWPSPAETSIKQITLGPESGPGTPLWQGRLGQNPDRFYPLVLGVPLTPHAFVDGWIPPIVIEGNTGTATVTVVLYRRRYNPFPPLLPVGSSSVLVSTRDLTAQAGRDYLPANFLISFAPEEVDVNKTVTFVVTADALPEPDEQFEVELQSNTGVIPVGLFYRAPPYFVTIRESRIVSLGLDNSGSTTVTFLAGSFQRFALDSSSDLMTWSVVPGAENLQGPTDRISFVDSTPPSLTGRRFYRTRILSP